MCAYAGRRDVMCKSNIFMCNMHAHVYVQCAYMCICTPGCWSPLAATVVHAYIHMCTRLCTFTRLFTYMCMCRPGCCQQLVGHPWQHLVGTSVNVEIHVCMCNIHVNMCTYTYVQTRLLVTLGSTACCPSAPRFHCHAPDQLPLLLPFTFTFIDI